MRSTYETFRSTFAVDTCSAWHKTCYLSSAKHEVGNVLGSRLGEGLCRRGLFTFLSLQIAITQRLAAPSGPSANGSGALMEVRRIRFKDSDPYSAL